MVKDKNKENNNYDRYLASVFIKNKDIIPNSETITALMMKLKDPEFLPNIIQEPTPQGIVQRIGFVSPDGVKQIVLGGKRFDITYSSQNVGNSDLGSFSEFCSKSGKIFSILLEHFKMKVNRLAAVTDQYLENFSESEVPKLVKNIFLLPNFYKENKVFEFDWRLNSRMTKEIVDKTEILNCITTIKKAREVLIGINPLGQNIQSSVQSIKISLDINTSPENQEERFDSEHASKFFNNVNSWHKGLKNDLNSFIKGE